MTTTAAITLAIAAALAGFAIGWLAPRRNSHDAQQAAALQSLKDAVAALDQAIHTTARSQRQELGDSIRKMGKDLSDQQAKSARGSDQMQRERLQDMTKTVQDLSGKVAEQLKDMRTENSTQMDKMRQTVDEKLQSTLEKRLGESFKQVSERLEAVHQGLGEMQNLATGVGDLRRVLTNVKARGTWGEVQLARLLDDMLTPQQFAANVETVPSSGRRVEFAIRLPGPERDDKAPIWLPIDAKFPKENYEKLVAAADAADVKGVEQAAKALADNVRKSAADIAAKYLAPPHTTDFGILYLPTEGLYAEISRQPDLAAEIQRKHRVLIAGPNSFSALLNSLQMGFRTLAIQKRSGEVWRILGQVKAEFGKFGDALGKVRKKLSEASNQMEQVGTRTRVLERKLGDVQSLPNPEDPDSPLPGLLPPDTPDS